MRTSACVLGALTCLVGRSPAAEADVSKAWAAAKDNLPANTQFVVALDIAAIYKSPLYPKALEMLKGVERDFGEVHALLKSACGWDPFSVVDGIVFAGDAKAADGVAFIQLTIDRTKASTCFESAMATLSKGKKVTVKQDGAYTVASHGTGKKDTAYFPWVAPNVVMVSIRPDHKETVDQWFNKKGFAKSKVGGLAGKVDPKAVIAGAFGVDKPFEASVPVTAAFGNLMLAGGKVSGILVATTTDAGAATKLAAMANDELQRDIKRDRTPAVVKKIMRAMVITASGSDLTIKGTVTEKDLGEAFVEAQKKKKSASGSAEAAVAKMDEFSKRMCACKDKACADKVNEDLTKWGTEMAKNAGKDDKPSPDLAKRAADIMTRYTDCMTKLMMQKNP